jgi:Bacteriophage lambda head decoration protein D
MVIKTQLNQLTDVLFWENDQNFTREEVTVASGQNLSIGDVVGKITKAGTASSAAFAGNTGDGAMGAVTVSAGAEPGDYKLVIVEPGTNLGTFTVEGPDGVVIGTGVVAAAFSAGGLSFTLADGAADFVAGDGFTITVAAGSGKYAIYNNAATDGTEVAAGVLLADADASAADVAGLILARGPAIVKSTGLGWNSQLQAAIDAGLADLAALNIISRTGV